MSRMEAPVVPAKGRRGTSPQRGTVCAGSVPVGMYPFYMAIIVHVSVLLPTSSWEYLIPSVGHSDYSKIFITFSQILNKVIHQRVQ